MTTAGLPRSERAERMERLLAVLTAAGVRPQNMGSWYVTLTLEDAEKLVAGLEAGK